jgi:hypothetical protein
VSDAGLLMIPLMLGGVVTANVSGQSTRKTGRYKRPPLIGLPIGVAAMAVVAFFADRLSPLAASALLALVGLGVGPIFPCATVAAQNAAARSQLGAVSGVVAFARALGGAISVAAASALVLGLAAGALASAGQIASLEDLARTDLPPEARAALARAFGITFGAVTAALAIGLAVFLRVEDRPLGERAPIATSPGAE